MYDGAEGEEEPEWVKNEKEQFSMYRDKDGDGFLNFEEVTHWRIPLYKIYDYIKIINFN